MSNEFTPQPPASKPSAQEWSQAFQAANGREPSMSEYQAAVAGGEIAQEGAPEHDPSVERMTEGLKQFAQGAKGFYESKVAPAAKSTLDAAQRMGESESFGPKGAVGVWLARAPFALAIFAFVAIIGLFLPALSVLGISVNYFSAGTDGDGPMLLFFFLLVIAGVVGIVMVGKKWMRITTAILGALFGFLGMVDGFSNMTDLPPLASVGFGSVLLGFAGLLMLASAAAMFYTMWLEHKATQGQTPAGGPGAGPAGPTGPVA